MTLETAVRLLEGKNLKADVQEESSEDVLSGTIIRYEPEDKVALGSTVTLYVSTGPEEEFVSVPNLYGKTDAEASVLLSAAGLVAGEISKEYDSTISAGHVISQGVEAGTQVAPGETVDYTVSLGPEAPKTVYRLPGCKLSPSGLLRTGGSVLRDPDPDPFKTDGKRKSDLHETCRAEVL